VAATSRQDGGLSKLDCFIRLDEVTYWLSRTRDLITNAETRSYLAFRESFRELRRESRKAEFALMVALYQFNKEWRNKPLMPTIDNYQWLAVLVKNTPSARFHLTVGNSDRGTVFFACEQAPLITFQNYGPPIRCPVCGIQNPLKGEPDRTQRP
jgi:hypothetical protein